MGEQIQVRSRFNPQTEYRLQLHRECRARGEGGEGEGQLEII